MTGEPETPYTTPAAVLAANGLLAARLDWQREPDDSDRLQRFGLMAADAVQEHGAGPIIMGLAEIAGALTRALARIAQKPEDEVLATIAGELTREWDA
jgi:hypothetical protein